MNYKGIAFLIVASFLLFGCAYASNGTDNFKVQTPYNHEFDASYYSLYFGQNQDCGVAIFKNVDDDAYPDHDNDKYDHLVHDDGREYITIDDDMKIAKNPDNTANFTDSDHAQHGAVEVVQANNEQFIVVFWAKDSSNITTADLVAQLTQFNKDNGLQAIAF